MNAVDMVREGVKECVLCGSSSRTSCDRGARYGLLHLQQCRDRGTICAEKARRRARPHRRLGRAPRQRDAGHFLQRRHGVSFSARTNRPWYPGTGAQAETGEGSGNGATLNCPFPAGSGRAEIIGAFRERLIPAMDHFRPELGADLRRVRFAAGRSPWPVPA